MYFVIVGADLAGSIMAETRRLHRHASQPATPSAPGSKGSSSLRSWSSRSAPTFDSGS